MKQLYRVKVSGEVIVFADDEKAAIKEGKFGLIMGDIDYMNYDLEVITKDNVRKEELTIPVWGSESGTTVEEVLSHMGNLVYRILSKFM